MREFSEFEQRIIRIFVDLHNIEKLSMANVLYELYGEDVFFINNITDLKPLKCKNTLNRETIFKELVLLQFLYDYLLKEGYLIEPLAFELMVSHPDFIDDNKLEEYNEYCQFYPSSIEWARKQFNRIWLSQVLIDLVNNNFKTQEQIRFEKQLSDAETQIDQNRRNTKVAYFAAIVSFIGLLGALILPFYTKTKLAEKDEIIKEIQAVKNKISAIYTKIANDTLDADIVTSTKIKSDANIINQPASIK